MKEILKTLILLAVFSSMVAVAVAREYEKTAPKGVSETWAKINQECDIKIVDATAIDLLEFISKQKVPIDYSEVKEQLKTKIITITVDAKKFSDIVMLTADQIGASVLIRDGSIKIVAAAKAATNQQSESGPRE